MDLQEKIELTMGFISQFWVILQKNSILKSFIVQWDSIDPSRLVIVYCEIKNTGFVVQTIKTGFNFFSQKNHLEPESFETSSIGCNSYERKNYRAANTTSKTLIFFDNCFNSKNWWCLTFGKRSRSCMMASEDWPQTLQRTAPTIIQVTNDLDSYQRSLTQEVIKKSTNRKKGKPYFTLSKKPSICFPVLWKV